MKVLIERALYSVIVVEVKDWFEAEKVLHQAKNGVLDSEFDKNTNDNSNYELVEVLE